MESCLVHEFEFEVEDVGAVVVEEVVVEEEEDELEDVVVVVVLLLVETAEWVCMVPKKLS